MENVTIKEKLRVKLFDQDLMRLGKQLAVVNQDLAQAELERAEVVSALAARVKSAKARVAELSARINSGYEEREVDCDVLMDTPRPGLKTVVRTDTAETVRIDTMNEQDRQLGLELQPPPAPESAAEAPPEERVGSAAWLERRWREAALKAPDALTEFEAWLISFDGPPATEQYAAWIDERHGESGAAPV